MILSSTFKDDKLSNNKLIGGRFFINLSVPMKY